VPDARLTGAGFGGCALALVATQQAEESATTSPERYRRATQPAGSVYVCAPSDGAYVQWVERPREGNQ
jgi:galactokinase